MNQTIHHPQIGDVYWMTVSVNFLIEFNGYSSLHTVAVHFRYDRYMRRLVNEFLRRKCVLFQVVCYADSVCTVHVNIMIRKITPSSFLHYGQHVLHLGDLVVSVQRACRSRSIRPSCVVLR